MGGGDASRLLSGGGAVDAYCFDWVEVRAFDELRNSSRHGFGRSMRQLGDWLGN